MIDCLLKFLVIITVVFALSFGGVFLNRWLVSKFVEKWVCAGYTVFVFAGAWWLACSV